MSEKFSWKTFGMETSVPERMSEFEYVKMNEIIDAPIIIGDFELFESKNTEKYSKDNASGVHILIGVVETGKTVRITTHSKPIVRAFQRVKEAGGDFPKDIITTITTYRTKNGTDTFVFGN